MLKNLITCFILLILLASPSISFSGQAFYVYKSPDPDASSKSHKDPKNNAQKNAQKNAQNNTDHRKSSSKKDSPARLRCNSSEQEVNQAKSGDENAQFMVGLNMYRGEGAGCNKDEGLLFLINAAKKGKYSDESLNIIGYEYYQGQNILKDHAESRKWLQIAADNDNAQAQNDLAYLFFNGLGGERDYQAAFALYQRSALRGHQLAQANLGTMYANGLGTEKNREKGYAWYDIASLNGNNAAMRNKKALSSEMTNDEINAAQRLASELFKTIEQAHTSDPSHENK